MSERRVGLAIGAGKATGVVLGRDDEVLARVLVPVEGDPTDVVAAMLDRLGTEHVTRVVVATSALTRPLYRPEVCGRVGVLRIGAPACAAVPPFTQWPAALVTAVAGPIELARGGHGYDGHASADLDLAAVESFGRRCRGVVGAVAVTAVHAQASRAHEEQAALILGDVLGPDVEIVTGSDDGGLGLLERENTAVLDAALAPAARRATEAIAAVMAARGMPEELYVLRGDGTVFPAQAAARRPLRTVGALHSAARVGGVHLAGESSAVVVDDDGARVRISSEIEGRPQESGRLVEVAGIRTNLRELRVTQVPAHLPREAFERAMAGLDAPLVLVGAAGRLSDALLPGRVLRPADAQHAAAIGAAVGEAAGSTDRIFWLGERSRTEAIAEARLLAEQAAIRAGADPLRLRAPAVHEALMTYVPTSCIRIRVQSVGPILTVGVPGDGP